MSYDLIVQLVMPTLSPGDDFDQGIPIGVQYVSPRLLRAKLMPNIQERHAIAQQNLSNPTRKRCRDFGLLTTEILGIHSLRYHIIRCSFCDQGIDLGTLALSPQFRVTEIPCLPTWIRDVDAKSGDSNFERQWADLRDLLNESLHVLDESSKAKFQTQGKLDSCLIVQRLLISSSRRKVLRDLVHRLATFVHQSFRWSSSYTSLAELMTSSPNLSRFHCLLYSKFESVKRGGPVLWFLDDIECCLPADTENARTLEASDDPSISEDDFANENIEAFQKLFILKSILSKAQKDLNWGQDRILGETSKRPFLGVVVVLRIVNPKDKGRLNAGAFDISSIVDYSVSYDETSDIRERNSQLLSNPAIEANGKKPRAVIGLSEPLACFRRMIEFYSAQGLSIPPPPGIGMLLYGPPGTGKTLFVREMAADHGMNLVSLDAGTLVQSGVGESERVLRYHFEEARNSGLDTILFVDEIEALFGKGTPHYMHRLRSLFVMELDLLMQEAQSWFKEWRVVNRSRNQVGTLYPGYRRHSIIVIAATNRPQDLDPSLLRSGRLENVFHVPLPSRDDRRRILSLAATRCGIPDLLPPAPNVSKTFGGSELLDFGQVLDKVADSTNGFSGADMESVIRKAAIRAVFEDRKIEARDILASREDSTSSVSWEDVVQLSAWSRKLA